MYIDAQQIMLMTKCHGKRTKRKKCLKIEIRLIELNFFHLSYKIPLNHTFTYTTHRSYLYFTNINQIVNWLI